MPSPPTLRKSGLLAEVSEIPAKTSMEGGLGQKTIKYSIVK